MSGFAAARVQSGFTLVEVTVALVILALSLGVVYESLGWSLRRSAALRHRESAWLVAQSQLAEIRRTPVSKQVDRSGSTPDGLRWSSRVRPLGSAAENDLQAFEVVVQVSWGRRIAQQVRLQSIEVPGLQP